MDNPLNIIEALNKTDPFLEIVFTRGACYDFHLFLKRFFDDAIPLLSKSKCHIISDIGGKYYDITGVVDNEGYERLDDHDVFTVQLWSFSDNHQHVIDKIKPLSEIPEMSDTDIDYFWNHQLVVN